MNLANTITLLRLASLVPFIYFMLKGSYGITLIILGVSGLSDLLDGYIARKLNQKTKLGAFLDPFADKIYIFTGNIILASKGVIPIWFFILVTSKDVSALLGTFVLNTKNVDWIPVPNIYGKTAVAMQVIIILMGIIHLGYFNLSPVIWFCAVICALFTVIAWFFYALDFSTLIKGSGEIKD